MPAPSDLITPGARWTPGAWTPARCVLWRTLGPRGKVWLEKCVMDEARAGVCLPSQLPPVGLADSA